MIPIIKQYLNGKGWDFSESDNKSILFNVSGANGTFKCIAGINQNADMPIFAFFIKCGVKVPLDKKCAVLELLNLLNEYTFIGHFEMNSENGEVSHRATLLYEYISPNLQLLEQIIMFSIFDMDRCIPGLMGVMFGGLTAAQALELIEDNDKTE